MVTSEWEELQQLAVDLSLVAGGMMTEARQSQLQISTKSSFCDLVTETDKQIEEHIKSLTQERYPHSRFIGEETDKSPLTDDLTFIVDPIDGTNNFVHNFPQFCVSIAVVQNRRPIIGVIYNPSTKELYTATEGSGAYKNGRRISVSTTSEMKSALVIAEYGGWRDERISQTKIRNNGRLIPHVAGIRMNGSAALNICHVAEGRAEAYFEFGIHVWDYSAGVVIAREAGACLMNPYDGGEVDILSRSVICACNRTIADGILSLIEPIPFEKEF